MKLASKLFLFLFLAAATQTACQNKSTVETAPNSSAEAAPASTGMQSSRGSDWAGTYRALMPCANCEGTETTLTINADNTYTVHIKFLGAPGAEELESSGHFEWSAVGDTIILDKYDYTPPKFLYDHQKIHQLDFIGKRAAGVDAEKYTFTKQ